MEMHELEQVFNEASFPNITFVEPKEYPHIRSAFKSRGKHVTISGPSGKGKTTLVVRLLKELQISSSDVLLVNGRQYTEIDSCFHLFGKELKCEPTYEEITPLLQLVRFISKRGR